MTFKAQVILTIVFIVLLGIILNMVKKRRLELKYVLVWMACDIVLILFTCFPQLMGGLSYILGIQSPMNMIFFLGLLMTLCIVFSLTIALSRVTEKVRKLSQIISMLPEEMIQDLEEKRNCEERKDENIT